MPRVCSSEAAAISAMMSRTWVTERTICSMVLPVLSTSSVPVFTRLTDSAISPSISLAAWALRLARLRTSLATTEKPRPCSPARARFDRGVERQDVGLEGNAVDQGGNFGDTLRTAGDIAHGADHVFHQLAAPAARSARRRWPADWRDGRCRRSVSPWRSAVPCWRRFPRPPPPCCSVREERSVLPAAISAEAVETWLTPIWIFSIMVRRFWLMAATAFSSCPSSSRRVLVCAWRRSPPAMRSAMASVLCSGRVICSVMRQAISTPAMMAIRVVMPICSCARLMLLRVCTSSSCIKALTSMPIACARSPSCRLICCSCS